MPSTGVFIFPPHLCYFVTTTLKFTEYEFTKLPLSSILFRKKVNKVKQHCVYS